MDKQPALPPWAAPANHHATTDQVWHKPDQFTIGEWSRVRHIALPHTPMTYQTRRYPQTGRPFDHPSQWQISPVPCDKDAVVHAMIRRLLADLGHPWRVTWTSMAYQPHGGSFTAARPCNLCHRGIGGARNNQVFMVTTDMFTPRYPPMDERDPLMYHPYTFFAAVLTGWTEHRRRHFENAANHLTHHDSRLIQASLHSHRRRLFSLAVELEVAIRARIPAYARLSAVQFPDTSTDQ